MQSGNPDRALGSVVMAAAARLLHRPAAMRNAAICLVLAASAATARPQPAPSPETSTLIVEVVGLRNARGKVDALLFRSADGFPDEESKAIADDVQIDPKTLTARIVFERVPPGPAAVTVLHDENMNEKLDRNLFGIPREGYGASNNPKKRARAPTFAEAQFSVSRPAETIQIRVIYW
jgi:uncharacterized protein (DUF2141 family)